MLFGRFFGWCLVLLALTLASGDVVMALGAVDYPGLATSEIVTLLVGEQPENAFTAAPSVFETLAAGLLSMPAWLVIGILGFSLAQACRPRRARRRRFTKV